VTSTQSRDGFVTEFIESCADCGRKTVHEVEIEIRTENEGSDNAAFSREPYRVSTCTGCGKTTAVRMNNAQKR
jgi:formate dehydrogenase assembly factor FdhD